jgi:hypothetical protein
MEFLPEIGDPAYLRLASTVIVLLAAFLLSKIAQRLIYRYVQEPEPRYRATRSTATTTPISDPPTNAIAVSGAPAGTGSRS